MSNPYNSATDRASVLGPTLFFKGDLSAEEDLLIQGRVEGSITHTQRLTVGPQGTVKANIRAQLIIVEGTVDGDLQADKADRKSTRLFSRGAALRLCPSPIRTACPLDLRALSKPTSAPNSSSWKAPSTATCRPIK